MLTEKSHAIYQNNEQTSFKKKGVEPVDPVRMNIYQSNTFRRLQLATFVDEPRIQER